MRFKFILSLGLSALLACSITACTGTEEADTPVTIPSWSLPSAASTSDAGEESEESSASAESRETATATDVSDTTSDSTTSYADVPDISQITAFCNATQFTGILTTLDVNVSNQSGRDISYKNTVTVEMNQNGQWVELPWATDADITPIAYLLGTGETGYIQLDFTQLANGPLKTLGRYRITIPVLSDGYADAFTVSTEFTLK